MRIILLVFLMSQVLSASTLKQSVSGFSGRTCTAYLHLPKNTTPSALVYYEWGSGIASVAHYIPVELIDLFSAGKIAVLTADKIGLSPATQSVPVGEVDTEAVVDRQVYIHITTAERVECGKNALIWALQSGRFTTDQGIFFQGHSEGAQVIALIYQDWLSSANPIAKSVRALLSSGSVIDDWKYILDYQLAEDEKKEPGITQKIWDALAQKDDETFMNWGGTGYRWIEAALKTPSMSTVYDNLALAEAPASFQFFHGLQDPLIRASALQDYEAKNLEKIRLKEKALSLHAHYYQCGHSLNSAGQQDIGNFIKACLNSTRPYCW